MTEGQNPEDPVPPKPPIYAAYASVWQFTSEVVTFLGIGFAVDYYWVTAPWGVVVGAVLGFAVGLYHLIQNVLPPKK